MKQGMINRLNERAAGSDAVSQHFRHERDVNFTVIATVHSHHVEYVAYEIAAWENNSPLYAIGQHHVEDIQYAQPFLHGSVKWDHCSNWHFDEQDRVMIHGCSRKHLQRIGEVLTLCWDWTAQLLPTWDTD